MPDTAVKRFMLAICLLTIGGPLTSMAAERGEITDEYIFQLMDMNGNQEIDRAEFLTQKMAVFSLRDIDRDLELNGSELGIFSDEVIAGIDTDRDGNVSPFEFNQAKVGMFESLDLNANGVITLEELLDFRARTK